MQETMGGFDWKVENQFDFFPASCKNINDDDFYSFIWGSFKSDSKIIWDWFSPDAFGDVEKEQFVWR